VLIRCSQTGFSLDTVYWLDLYFKIKGYLGSVSRSCMVLCHFCCFFNQYKHLNLSYKIFWKFVDDCFLIQTTYLNFVS